MRLETGGGAVAYEEDTGNWALVHMHVSVGVPDKEVLELQGRWGTGPGG